MHVISRRRRRNMSDVSERKDEREQKGRGGFRQDPADRIL